MEAPTNTVGLRIGAARTVQSRKEVRADHVLFNFAEETIPVMLTNTGDEEVMIHKDTTVGQSELVATIKFKTLVHSAKVRN